MASDMEVAYTHHKFAHTQFCKFATSKLVNKNYKDVIFVIFS